MTIAVYWNVKNQMKQILKGGRDYISIIDYAVYKRVRERRITPGYS